MIESIKITTIEIGVTKRYCDRKHEWEKYPVRK